MAIHVFIKQIYKTWSGWIIMKICFSYYLAFLHKAYNTEPWRFNILQSDHIFLNAKSLQNHHLPDWTSFSVNACVLKVFHLLLDILESVLEKHRHLVAATPPPSPTSGEDGSTRRRSSSVMLFSSPLESSDTGKYTVMNTEIFYLSNVLHWRLKFWHTKWNNYTEGNKIKNLQIFCKMFNEAGSLYCLLSR